MSFLCDECGYVYEWEMFFNNHMRAAHRVKVNTIQRGVLPKDITKFLEYYFHHICGNPSLDEIKELSEDLEVKKEKIYWWFVNYRKRDKKHMQKYGEIKKNRSIKRVEGKKSSSKDGVIGREGHDASVSLATSKRGKREKKGSRIRARGIENNSRTSATKRGGSLSEKTRSIYSRYKRKLL